MADGGNKVDDFSLLDHEDEEQILAELRGGMNDKFVYQNARGEYGLSYAGTKWAVRQMAERGEAIRIDEHPKVSACPVDPEYIVVTVLAKRVKLDKDSAKETVLDSTIGSSRGWSKQKRREGGAVPDEHFFTKTVSKATRNAQQALMSVDFMREMIDRLSKKKPGAAKTVVDKAVVDKAVVVKAQEVLNEYHASKPPEAPPAAPAAVTRGSLPKAEASKQDDASAVRQRLFAVLSLIDKNKEKGRAIFTALTGKEKSHDVDTPTLVKLTGALKQVVDGVATITTSGKGIIHKTDMSVLFGEAFNSAAPPAAGAEEMF